MSGSRTRCLAKTAKCNCCQYFQTQILYCHFNVIQNTMKTRTMKTPEILELFKRFEQASTMVDGIECWSARELMQLLGYTKWENFEKVVTKAKESCQNAGMQVDDHFHEIEKVVKAGKGAQHEVEDILLTRYASYLVAQNGDSRKQEIAFAQNYFAVQTRRAEQVELRLLEFERLRAREKLTESEKNLSATIYDRGVDSTGFGLIRSKGDQALFNLSTAALKKKMGAPDKRPLADFLPTISIKAKDFATEMTNVNVINNDLRGQIPIEIEHVTNNAVVRKLLVDRGIVPENLPPAEDVKKLKRKHDADSKLLAKAVSKPKK